MRIKKIVQWVLCLSFVSIFCAAEMPKENAAEKLTYKKVAVILVKRSGLFDRYVPVKADDKWCVEFLNKLGIQLYLKKDSIKKEFTKKDMARVLGQIELLLSGKASYLDGRIQLPSLNKSWEEFCAINQITYRDIYKGMCDA
jgi:hypothetical protein